MEASLGANLRYFTRRNRNTLLTFALFVVVFVLVNTLTTGTFGYYDLATMVSTGATLALAAMGQTFVILIGGFDLSAGATISLVNVTVASLMTDGIANQILVGLVGIAVGGCVGAFNGFFIAVLRMQPIVVTLATLFIVQGAALLVRATPGGYVAQSFMDFLSGAAIPGILPSSLVVIAVALLVWYFVRNSRFGTAIYAVGSDEGAATAAGVRARRVKFFTYILGGCFYGAAGVFLSAQSGGSDPLVGEPMLLQIFAAVVLGGTMLGGGRGGLIGSVIGAYLLMMFVNVLLIFNLPAFLSPIADGVVLILAVLLGSLGSKGALLDNLAEIGRQLAGTRIRRGTASRGGFALPAAPKGGRPRIGWLDRNGDDLKSALPSYVTFVLLVIATWIYFGALTPAYIRSLLVLSCFLGILAFGQATVVLTGGLDLSLPWAITLCGAIFASLANGQDVALLWSVPAVLACGIAIGIVNGIGIAVVGLPPIVMTLAANGILQGITLFYTQGSPSGFTPPSLKWLTAGEWGGLTPVIWFFLIFVVVATFVLSSSYLGRRIYAVGNGPQVAHLSGINVRTTLISAYAISGLCAAIVGILLIGFNGAASLALGDEYLLPSIAVVVAGGVLITGGRGHYLGVIGGVLLLIALQILIGGTMLPDAVRGIIFGFVMLGALMALQQRRPT